VEVNAGVQRLSHEVGWGYKEIVDRLEEKRKIKAQAYFERKVCSVRCCIVLILSYNRALQRSCAKRLLLKLHRHSRVSPSWLTRSITTFSRRLEAVEVHVYCSCAYAGRYISSTYGANFFQANVT
jgi:hypothetical protein